MYRQKNVTNMIVWLAATSGHEYLEENRVAN